MGYHSLAECLADLKRTGQLVELEHEVDPNLEAAVIQRRVFEAGGPAILFRRVKGSPFPMVANLFGTLDRARFLFRDTLAAVRQLIELKGNIPRSLSELWRLRGLSATAAHMVPKWVREGPILAHETTVSQIPQLRCWPQDGGPFLTLPLVYTEDPDRPGWTHSNLGMYRVQLAGNDYEPDREVGLHYQIHRGIGVHHTAAVRRGERLKVNVFVGGPPALTIGAVMPLPEGLPEIGFAGALGGRRIRLTRASGDGLPLLADADFALCGTVDPDRNKPEGPFGDHLGYYSLRHDFPVLRVERVYHRPGAILPFTTVGRPPQEDTTFGQLIHELTGPVIPKVLPGVKAVHAVDEAGVHPLLLAIGSERYVPFAPERRPMELLTQAHAILGQGQLSLAKYLLIMDDQPGLDIHDPAAFLQRLLERVDWSNDLHFQTRTTIDTLDYSGSGLNLGSKVVIAAVGPPRRPLPLPTELPPGFELPAGFSDPRVCMPGVLAIKAPEYVFDDQAMVIFTKSYKPHDPINAFPLITLTDDSEFVARSPRNFLWVTFTRSNPATDIDGIGAMIQAKHWGCAGSLVIDTRRKPHHAPPLEDDPEVVRRVESLGAPGGPLHGLI